MIEIQTIKYNEQLGAKLLKNSRSIIKILWKETIKSKRYLALTSLLTINRLKNSALKKLPIESCFEINSSKKFKDVFKKNCYFK